MQSHEQRVGRGLWTTVRLLPRLHRGATLLLVGLVLVAAALPAVTKVASGQAVGAVPGAVGDGFGGPAGRTLIWAVVFVGLAYLAQQVGEVVTNLMGSVLGRKVNGTLQEHVMDASLSPAGIAHLEDREVLDRMALARNVGPGAFTPGGAVAGMATSMRGYLSVLASAAVLATWSPLLAAGAVVVSIAVNVIATRVFFQMVDIVVGNNADLRRAIYFRDLAVTRAAAKELRVFGLAGWVRRRFSDAWLSAMTVAWRERRSGRASFLAVTAIDTVVVFAGVAVIGAAGARGELDLGEFTVMLLAFLGTLELAIGDFTIQAGYGAAAVPAILELTDLVDQDRFVAGGTAPAPRPTREIRFDDIGFHYPDSPHPVFEHLDLTLRVGESLAIVGPNGAGKTTLVKLLCRLYEPTDGRITIDGTPLAGLDPDSWRQHLAVLFQDFIRYQLSAADNVGFGAPTIRDPESLERAASRAGLSPHLDRLEQGWDTPLAQGVEGGVDLSGGQWQRVALARALVAVEGGASVLVLDEPTANLDVRAEAEFYDRFLDLTSGLTTIVVSHRFSTVRRADRIVVVEGGRITEEGSHPELLEREGTYARMFRLQAARFGNEVRSDA